MARLAEPYLATAPRSAIVSTQQTKSNTGVALDGSRTLAGMLLAASMAALLVVADQVIDTWTDGHLLAGWVALWTVAFAGLALLAPPMRKIAAFAAGGFLTYLAEVRAKSEEERMWEMASHDPRVLEEIRAAMTRHADAA